MLCSRESLHFHGIFSLSLFLLFIKVLTHLICSSLTGRNKLPPLVPPRSCSSTPPRRTPKSWVSRSKTASRTPRRKSLSNRSFRTADRLSTSRRTVARTSRLLTVDWRRTLRDRTLGARRLRVNRASTSWVVRRNKSNIEALRLNDWRWTLSLSQFLSLLFLHRQVNLFIRSKRVSLSIMPLSNATYTHQLFNQTLYIRTKYKKKKSTLSVSLSLPVLLVVVHPRNII